MHNTKVETTVSTDPSGNGSCSAGASTSRARSATARQPLLEAATHRGVGFDQDQLVEVVGVVAQVQAGAAADLHRAAGRSLRAAPCGARAVPPARRPTGRGRTRPRRRAPRRASPPTVRRVLMSVSMRATMTDPASPRIARPGHPHKMARSGDRRQSKPKRAASATAAVREPRPSLWRMFATWRCTV